MRHLKLVVDQRQVELDQVMGMKTWSEEEKKILSQIDQYAHFFREKKASSGPNQHEFSKHFLIFCFNYYELGLPQKAREMLSEIDPSYFQEGLLRDMEVAVYHRNQAELFEGKRKFAKAQEHRIEAEYFIVAAKILFYLRQEPMIKDHPSFQLFLKELAGKTFFVEIHPILKVIS